MSERFQRLFCAGCFAVVLMALPGALREARRSLGGPYSVAAHTLASPSLAIIAPVGPPVDTLDSPAAQGTVAVRVKHPPASGASAARARAVPSPAHARAHAPVPAQIPTVAASDRPVHYRDGLARPGI